MTIECFLDYGINDATSYDVTVFHWLASTHV